MPEAIKTYRYTAQRSSYLTMIGTFIFLFIIEGALTELLVSVLVSTLWLKLTIIIATVGSYVYIAVVMLYPLWTTHALTAGQLHLRYGLTLNLQIPLDSINTVQAIEKSSSRIQPISARYEAQKQRIVACFSEQGMVLLTFAQPLNLKLGRQKRATTNILLNVDQRAAFMDAVMGAQHASA